MIQPTWARLGFALYRADCRDVLVQLDRPAAVLTDPPYGIRVPQWPHSTRAPAILGDEDTSLRDEVLAWLGSIPALVFGSWRVPAPLRTRAVLIWSKGEHTGMGDLSIPWRADTECIHVLGDGFVGSRRSSVLHHLAVAGTVAMHRGGKAHPAEKPVSLLLELLQCCPPGTVLDPFMGSGSTAIACWRARRPFVGIEIDETIFRSAVTRIEAEIAGEPLLAERPQAGTEGA